MEINKKTQLNQLKQKQKDNNFIKETKKIKSRIMSEIPSFDERYYFISEDEVEKVNYSLDFLPQMVGTIPNFQLFNNVIYFEPIQKALSLEGNAWCKFAVGGNYNEFMPYGSIQNFIEDIRYWLPYGSPLYLLCENKQDIIFVNWHSYAIKASMPRLYTT